MHRVIARGRDERGFTMVTVMAVTLIVTLLSIAALSAAQGDLRPGSHDKSRKVAYAAAEAGVQNYLFHLSQDPNYWAKCTTGAQPNAINDPWNGVSPATDPRRWTALPDSKARYTIELMPANGASACSTASPDATMIDAASGTFRIRATGQDTTTSVKRSIIATFRRKSFLDYLYFTDKETRAPGLYGMNVPSRVTRDKAGSGLDLIGWARQRCDRYWGDDPSLGNRGGQSYDGQFQHSDGTWEDIAAGPLTCNEPQFSAGDVIAGPMHTNDEILIDCATPAPKLGDSIDDAIETSSLGRIAVTPANANGGWRGNPNSDALCPSPGEPYVNFSTTSPARAAGTWTPRAAPLQLPLTNSALKKDTAAAYRFKGTTKITLSATTMKVTGTRDDGTVLSAADVAIPADGVVYVASNGACPEYDAVDSAAAPATCGNLELKGDYAANVTFTAENDIVVKGNLQRTSSGSPFLLGLIATNYVRVDHPVTGCSPASPVTCNYRTGCTNAAASPTNVAIAAAILSLTRSFIVDNWFCGDKLGTLHVNGAIAQNYRGPVSRDNTGIPGPPFSGYDKDYTYDSQLKYRSPPHFLDPVAAQWRVQTFSEQVPAR
jgi:Tfp pilus assembly protein PilX